MPLQIPEPASVWTESMESTSERLRAYVGTCDASGSSLRGYLTSMVAAMDLCSKNEYWTGHAATACRKNFDDLMVRLVEAVEELEKSVDELDLYIEIYKYVDNAATETAEEAAQTIQQTATEG